MGKTFKFLRCINLLVTPYDFNVSNSEKSEKSEKSLTLIGGSLSLFVILLMIAYTINYYIKLATAQASVYTGTDAQEQQIHKLDQSQMGFALELTKTKGSIISYMEGLSQYFTVEATVVEQIREQGVYGYERISTPLIPQRCSKEYIEQFNFKTLSFTQQQLDNFICFNGTYHLNGQFYDPNFTYIKIDIIKCQGNNCKSEKEIYDFLDGGVDVDLFIKDTNIKSKYDPTNPAEIFPTNIFWRLTTSVGNNEDIFISPVTIDKVLNKDIPFDGSTTDTRQYQSSKVTKQERRQMSFDLQTVTSMCTFYFRMSNSSNNYFINDTSTLALCLASISEGAGLTLAIISVLKILYKFYCEHKTLEIIMNHVFEFESNNEIIDEQNDTHFGKKITYGFCSYLIYIIKSFLQTIFKNPDLEFCKINDEITKLQLAKDQIQNELDLAQIVRKLYEIDYIKLFLFDDDQVQLFNTYCQTVILKDKDKQINNNKPFNQDKKSIYKTESVGADQMLQSTIPISIRSLQLSDFFYSQVKVKDRQHKEKILKKIKYKENVNNKKNLRFINFLTKNTFFSQLKSYENISDNTQKKPPVQKSQFSKQVPKQEEESQQISDDRNNVNQGNFDTEQVQQQEEYGNIKFIKTNSERNPPLNE